MPELFWTCFELSPENTGNQCSVFKIVYYFDSLINRLDAGFWSTAEEQKNWHLLGVLIQDSLHSKVFSLEALK